MNIRALIFISLVGIFSCSKKTNPTPQLASGSAFVLPADSVAEVFKAKPVPPWAPKIHSYKPSAERKWDLLHVRLELEPVWEKQELIGNATLSLQPYFYQQDSLLLDGRGFEVYSAEAISGTQLVSKAFRYDGEKIRIGLSRAFRKGEVLKVKIKYRAKPTELPKGGSLAITDDQGIYFINPDGKKPGIPQQIWTQGETRGARCWFPCIDEPNEKCTQEMHITVENRFKTLSNGLLSKSIKKENGMRTDVWEMKLPHSPYLFMMAIGEFEVVADKCGKLPLHYWVEPKYRKVAGKIFGNTPAMISHFSRLLDYPFPWPKYDQVVVRNFVSGAMENTSASVFMEALQCSAKELVDRNWDDIIAHELFHQWFGDLVTLESWANLPLNESFANYAEYLWLEHHVGRNDADLAGLREKQQYFYEASRKCEPLIRFHHDKPDDMFDSHSYAKGGRILHMLRNELGDDAFFESLKLYLKRNAFKTAEIHDLRMAMEEVSGRDLNWFFNQWFLKPGHPELRTETAFSGNQLEIRIHQEQDTSYFPVYRLHIPVDIYTGGTVRREILLLDALSDTFRFQMPNEPELVLLDAEASILARFNTTKTAEQWQAQYRLARLGIHRIITLQEIRETIEKSPSIDKIWETALKDSFWVCREMALDELQEKDSLMISRLLPEVQKMAVADPKPSVRKAALEVLAQVKFREKRELLLVAMKDSSLAASSEAYKQYFVEEFDDAEAKRKELEKDSSNDYQGVLAEFYALRSGKESFEWFKTRLLEPDGSSYEMLRAFGRFLNAETNPERKQDGFQLIFKLGMEGTRPEQVIGAYQLIRMLDGIPDAAEKRKAIREQHRNDDFHEILEYMD